ncbi:MAG: Holliday junction resolvase RuvX [Actinomycetota bacterium]
MRVVALDLGSKRIGVAVSDLTGTIASPHSVINRSSNPRHDHDTIRRLVLDEEAEAIVIGLPLSLDGSTGPAAKAVLDEAKRIGTVVGVPVHLQDERLSTVAANRLLREADLSATQRRQFVDKVAAAVILQTWLDAQQLS